MRNLNPTEIDVDWVRSILKDIQDYPTPQQKIYTFKNSAREIMGIAYFKESGSGGVLSRLVTNPKFENQGVGRAIIKGLKGRYKHIRVTPDPFDNHKDTTERSQRLQRFYRANGFSGGDYIWSSNQISLDDEEIAGDWQNLSSERVYQVGIGQHLVSPLDIIRHSMKRMLDRQDIQISDEARSLLQKWQVANETKVSLEKKENLRPRK